MLTSSVLICLSYARYYNRIISTAFNFVIRVIVYIDWLIPRSLLRILYDSSLTLMIPPYFNGIFQEGHLLPKWNFHFKLVLMHLPVKLNIWEVVQVHVRVYRLACIQKKKL